MSWREIQLKVTWWHVALLLFVHDRGLTGWSVTESTSVCSKFIKVNWSNSIIWAVMVSVWTVSISIFSLNTFIKKFSYFKIFRKFFFKIFQNLFLKFFKIFFQISLKICITCSTFRKTSSHSSSVFDQERSLWKEVLKIFRNLNRVFNLNSHSWLRLCIYHWTTKLARNWTNHKWKFRNTKTKGFAGRGKCAGTTASNR